MSDSDKLIIAEMQREINRLNTLAKEAFFAWDNDRDSRLGKLLKAMTDRDFSRQYMPDLTPRD